MRYRNSRWEVLICVLALSTGALACTPAKGAKSVQDVATAPEVATEDHGVAGQLGSDAVGVLLVNDLRPHAAGVLASSFGRALGLGTLAKDLDWIPEGVGLSWTEEGVSSIDSTVRAALLLALAATSAETAEADAKIERPRIHQQLLETLPLVTLTGWRAAVEFRSAEQAEEVMSTLGKWLETAAAELEGLLIVKARPTTYEIVLHVPEEWSEEMLVALLVELDVAKEDDEHVLGLAKALRALRVEARVERRGKLLRANLGGGRDRHPGTPTMALPPAPFSGSAPPLVAVGAELGSWKRATSGWDTLWDEWRSTAAGRALARKDRETEGMLLDLQVMADRMSEEADHYALRLDVGERRLEVTVAERGAPTRGSPLQGEPILGWIPAGLAAYGVDNERNLGRFLADLVTKFEDRLARLWLRAEIERESDSENKYDSLSDAYYKNFADLRELLLTEKQNPFTAPFAWVVDTQTGALPGVALLSRVHGDRDALAYLQRVESQLIQAFVEAQGRRAPRDLSMTKKDLGVGVTTYALSQPMVDVLIAQLERSDRKPLAVKLRSLAPHLRWHCFQHDGLVVVSTSPDLSRRLLAGARAQKPTLVLPDPRAVSYLSIAGPAFERPFALLLADTEPGTRAVFTALLREFASLEGGSNFEGETRRSRYSLRLGGE